MQVPHVFGVGDLRLREVDAPSPGARDVVVAVHSVGICGSDLGYIAAGGVAGPATAPIPLGHELSGTVDAVGAAVTTVRVGDRVAVNPLVNLIGNGGPEGGFAERLLVRDVAGRPESLVLLPDGIPFELGALVEPLAVAAHALDRLGVKAGDRIAIFGAGPIGLAALAVLRHRGVEDAVMFEPSAFRRERARALGASAALDPREEAPAAALMRCHGTVRVFRADAPATTHFLEASGAPVLPDIVRFARAGATACVVSSQKKPAEIDFRQVMAKELTLTGALGYPSGFGEIVRMLETGALDPAPMVSHHVDASEVLQAFEIARQADRSAKVLVRYGT